MITIYHINAGSSGAEERALGEAVAANRNLGWAATPEQADVFVVTGPVPPGVRPALLSVWRDFIAGRAPLIALGRASIDGHPFGKGGLAELAEVHWYRREFQEAEKLSLRSIEVLERALGPEHPGLISALNTLATARIGLRWKAPEVLPLLERAMRLMQASVGADERVHGALAAQLRADEDLKTLAATADELAIENDRLRAEVADLKGRLNKTVNAYNAQRQSSAAATAKAETLQATIDQLTAAIAGKAAAKSDKAA